jgi:hypothetical protein
LTKKVFGLDTLPGIQRDGTVLDRNYYSDGRWVRFQRKRPRKILGYREIVNNLAGPSRGIYLDPNDGFNNVFSGYNDGLQVLSITNSGIGAGLLDFTLSNFTPSNNNLWQFDSEFDSAGSGQQLLLAHPGQNLAQIDSTVNTPVLAGDITGTTLSAIGIFTATGTSDGTDTITLDTTNLIVGAGQLVTGTNVPANTYVVSITGGTTVVLTNPVGATIDTYTITNAGSGYADAVYTAEPLTGGTGTGATADITVTGGVVTNIANFVGGDGYLVGDVLSATLGGGGTGFEITVDTCLPTNITFTFDNQVSVSGGVVVLHPYVFVYGNNGLIRNSSAGNINDWVSADANETNVAATKVVKGLPVRGGSNAPSGLFWSLDSLIRVSYAPTTVNTGVTSNTFYWRYDVISSQSSILSSSCVIEYDGIYYWIGVDRFMLYNGVVKEIPNDFNQNYFFDNLNYAQAQKVYATKVPRFGEIWWFYPRGDSTECNDAIIYNVRENCWYDAGTALGSQRSAGYFSQVFRYPINASWNVNDSGGLGFTSIYNAGSGYTDGEYPLSVLDGGTGSGGVATITVTGGVVTDVVITAKGTGYTTSDILTSSAFDALAGGSGFELIVDSTINFVSLYQHEFGVDAIYSNQSHAIQSYFETNNLGWITGGPAQQGLEGANYWLRLERVEPDFIQSEDMTLYVTGRPYAQADDSTTGPYIFSPDTHKIDMKEQRRELRLKFESNVTNGNYQLGYLVLSADIGDVRGY